MHFSPGNLDGLDRRPKVATQAFQKAQTHVNGTAVGGTPTALDTLPRTF